METKQSQIAPRVSAIIPCYNTAALISRCLDSVFAQTFRDFEVIVVNDGSPDTPDLEKVLEPYMSRIVYIKQANKRCAGARNTGIAKARGEFLAFLDSDDLWLPYHLESQMRQFDADPSLALVYANATLAGNPTRQIDFMTNCPSEGPATFETIAVERCQIPIATVVARKAAILKAGGFDESLARCDDYDMWLRTAFYGGRVGYIRQITARIDPGRPGSLGAVRAKMMESYWQILQNADRKLPLTDAQRRIVRDRAAQIRAQYLLEEGKLELSARNFSRARQRFAEANRYLKRPRLSLMLLGLKLAPNATGKLFTYWKQRHDSAPA
jgi:glycosyltransferase involved in cell wall biosynthesis